MTIATKTFADLFTVTRAGIATRVNSAGLIESVAANQPRIDYDPVTLECKGLLIEEGRTNLLTYSAQFDNAAWNNTESAVNPNLSTAPDGTVSATKLLESVANSQHYMVQSNATPGSAFYTFSIYAKAGERTNLYIDFGGVGSYGASFDLSAGTTQVGGGNPATSSIERVFDDWYRCTVTPSVALDASAGYVPLIFVNQYGPYLGDGASGLFIWGAQLEAGAFATSYIPTTSAAVTRNADVVTHTIIPAQYSNSDATLFAEVSCDITPPSTETTFSAGFGTPGQINMAMYGSIAFGGIHSQFSQQDTAYAVDQIFKIASSINGGNCITGINGVASAAQGYTPGAVPTTLSISGARCHVRKIKYSPDNQTAVELMELTA